MLQYGSLELKGDTETIGAARDSRLGNTMHDMISTAPLVRCTYVVTGETLWLSQAMFVSAAARGAVVLAEKE